MFHKRGWLISRGLVFFFFFFSVFFFFLGGGGGGKWRRKGMITTFGIDPFRCGDCYFYQECFFKPPIKFNKKENTQQKGSTLVANVLIYVY